MTRHDALAFLDLARRARWDLPTSAGRPVLGEPAEPARRLVEGRAGLAGAVTALADAVEVEAAVELAGRSWRAFVLGRDRAGGRALLAAALDLGGPSRWRADARYGEALLAHAAGDRRAARERAAQALADAEASGAPEALVLGHLAVARSAIGDGDAALAARHARLAREAGRPLGEAWEQAPLHQQAQAALLAGDLAGAAAHFAESLALNRRLGDAGMVDVEHHNLGHAELRRGDVAAAERAFAGCRPPAADDVFGRAYDAVNRGCVAVVRGDRAAAARLLTDAEGLLRGAGADPADEPEVRWLRDALGSPPRGEGALAPAT